MKFTMPLTKDSELENGLESVVDVSEPFILGADKISIPGSNFIEVPRWTHDEGIEFPSFAHVKIKEEPLDDYETFPSSSTIEQVCSVVEEDSHEASTKILRNILSKHGTQPNSDQISSTVSGVACNSFNKEMPKALDRPCPVKIKQEPIDEDLPCKPYSQIHHESLPTPPPAILYSTVPNPKVQVDTCPFDARNSLMHGRSKEISNKAPCSAPVTCESPIIGHLPTSQQVESVSSATHNPAFSSMCPMLPHIHTIEQDKNSPLPRESVPFSEAVSNNVQNRSIQAMLMKSVHIKQEPLDLYYEMAECPGKQIATELSNSPIPVFQKPAVSSPKQKRLPVQEFHASTPLHEIPPIKIKLEKMDAFCELVEKAPPELSKHLDNSTLIEKSTPQENSNLKLVDYEKSTDSDGSPNDLSSLIDTHCGQLDTRPLKDTASWQPSHENAHPSTSTEMTVQIPCLKNLSTLEKFDPKDHGFCSWERKEDELQFCSRINGAVKENEHLLFSICNFSASDGQNLSNELTINSEIPSIQDVIPMQVHSNQSIQGIGSREFTASPSASSFSMSSSSGMSPHQRTIPALYEKSNFAEARNPMLSVSQQYYLPNTDHPVGDSIHLPDFIKALQGRQIYTNELSRSPFLSTPPLPSSSPLQHHQQRDSFQMSNSLMSFGMHLHQEASEQARGSPLLRTPPLPSISPVQYQQRGNSIPDPSRDAHGIHTNVQNESHRMNPSPDFSFNVSDSLVPRIKTEVTGDLQNLVPKKEVILNTNSKPVLPESLLSTDILKKIIQSVNATPTSSQNGVTNAKESEKEGTPHLPPQVEIDEELRKTLKAIEEEDLQYKRSYSLRSSRKNTPPTPPLPKKAKRNRKKKIDELNEMEVKASCEEKSESHVLNTQLIETQSSRVIASSDLNNARKTKGHVKSKRGRPKKKSTRRKNTQMKNIEEKRSEDDNVKEMEIQDDELEKIHDDIFTDEKMSSDDEYMVEREKTPKREEKERTPEKEHIELSVNDSPKKRKSIYEKILQRKKVCLEKDQSKLPIKKALVCIIDPLPLSSIKMKKGGKRDDEKVQKNTDSSDSDVDKPVEKFTKERDVPQHLDTTSRTEYKIPRISNAMSKSPDRSSSIDYRPSRAEHITPRNTRHENTRHKNSFRYEVAPADRRHEIVPLVRSKIPGEQRKIERYNNSYRGSFLTEPIAKPPPLSRTMKPKLKPSTNEARIESMHKSTDVPTYLETALQSNINNDSIQPHQFQIPVIDASNESYYNKAHYETSMHGVSVHREESVNHGSFRDPRLNNRRTVSYSISESERRSRATPYFPYPKLPSNSAACVQSSRDTDNRKNINYSSSSRLSSTSSSIHLGSPNFAVNPPLPPLSIPGNPPLPVSPEPIDVCSTGSASPSPCSTSSRSSSSYIYGYVPKHGTWPQFTDDIREPHVQLPSSESTLQQPGAKPLSLTERELVSHSKQNYVTVNKEVLLLPEYLKNAVGRKVLSPMDVVMISLSWNINWLNEQRFLNEPPPISNDVPQISKLYNNSTDYITRYSSYLIHEFWQRIFCSWKSNPKEFEFAIRNIQVKGDMVEMEIFANIDKVPGFDSYYVSLHFKSRDLQDVKVFGFISSHSYGKGSSKRTVHLIVKMIYRLQNIDTKGVVSLRFLCDFTPLLKQIEALKCIQKSAFFKGILNPANLSWQKIVLDRVRTSDSDTLMQAARRISDSLSLNNRKPNLTVVETPVGSDPLSTLIALIESLKNKKVENLDTSRILVCCRSIKKLEEIGFRLLPTSGNDDSSDIRTVILVKANKLNRELRDICLESLVHRHQQKEKEHLAQNVEKTKTSDEFSRKYVLTSCDVVLTLVTTCHTEEVHNVLTQPCFTLAILDEAAICTEPEALIPLLYNIEKYVLFVDTSATPKVISRFARQRGYTSSLPKRISM